MPTEHVRYSFKFDELSDTAKVNAVETVAAKLSGDWWDESDNESIAETLVYSLGASFKSPGWDTFGEGDFPGIDGVKVTGWDLEGSDYIALKGTLTADNAPGLDWPSKGAIAALTDGRNGTDIEVSTDCDCFSSLIHDEECEWFGVTPEELGDSLDRLNHAIRDCLSKATSDGRTQLQYIGSEDNARYWIEANEPDFTETGDLF